MGIIKFFHKCVELVIGGVVLSILALSILGVIAMYAIQAAQLGVR